MRDAKKRRCLQSWLLAAVKPDNDANIPNRSSILVLATVAGKRILLTGDGRGKDVIAGLTRAGLMAKGGALHVDALKEPHHGSARNASPDFFRRVTADVDVLCADVTNAPPTTRRWNGWCRRSRRRDDAQRLRQRR